MQKSNIPKSCFRKPPIVMRKRDKITLFLSLLLVTLLTYSQNLEEEIIKNGILFQKDMDSAYAQLDKLILEASKQNKTTLELSLLDRKCHYFYNKMDINNLFSSAKQLEDKSIIYKNKVYQAAANLYRSESLSMNELPDKALTSLNKAEALIEASDESSHRVFLIRSNILLSQANIYFDKKEYPQSIQKIKKVIQSAHFLKDSAQYAGFQFVNYSNLANVYLYENIDSAKVYVNKSDALSANGDLNIIGSNYYILGKISEKQHDTINALKYYLKSYTILDKSGDALNVAQLYESLRDIYESLGKADSALIFEKKYSYHQQNNLESKYKSLKKIIKASDTPDNSKTYLYLFIILGVILILVSIFFVFFYKKGNPNKDAPEEETIVKEPEVDLESKYDILFELLKKNDPAFLAVFEEIFPDFRTKLLEINPELSISEITFCALLKLNLSTKQIAQFTFIEVRTVQNKKHRIRKRLDVPKNMDTYNFFSEL